jgi:hypothetical protein
VTLALHGFQDWQQSLQTADLSVNISSQAIGAHNFFNSQVFDMRQYSSYALMFEIKTVAAATQYDHVSITMVWTSDAAATQIEFEENYHIFAQDSAFGAFQSDYGRFEIQDMVHAAFLQVVVENDSPDNCTANFNFYGMSRTIARRYLANPFAFSGVGIDFNDRLLVAQTNTAIGAGVTHNYLLRMAPGRASVQWFCAAATVQFHLFMPDGTGFFIWQPAAGVSLYQDIALPRSAVRLAVFNFGGAGTTYHAFVAADFPDG